MAGAAYTFRPWEIPVRRLIAAAAALAALALPASAGAIINGQPDGQQHPNVGGLLSGAPLFSGSWTYCSGTLISPTVLLTAAHCGASGTRVAVTFDEAYQPGGRRYFGTFYAHPDFNQSQDDPRDIAVVRLDQAPAGVQPARIVQEGALAHLPMPQPLRAVGYGAYETRMGAGGPVQLYDDVRRQAVSVVNAVTPSWLRASMNAAKGDGGTCFGDSGGPNFLAGTDVVAAITITGDTVCRATNVSYRLDKPQARAFLAAFVALP